MDARELLDRFAAWRATPQLLKVPEDAYADAADEANPARDLIPVAWRWAKGDPVPIYFRNEGLISATEKLHDVEQTDAILVRKRIALSKDMIGRH